MSVVDRNPPICLGWSSQPQGGSFQPTQDISPLQVHWVRRLSRRTVARPLCCTPSWDRTPTCHQSSIPIHPSPSKQQMWPLMLICICTLIQLMRNTADAAYTADTADEIIRLMLPILLICLCCWCSRCLADAAYDADALMLLMRWCCWFCWWTNTADAADTADELIRLMLLILLMN